jgi:hypothetical protein
MADATPEMPYALFGPDNGKWWVELCDSHEALRAELETLQAQNAELLAALPYIGRLLDAVQDGILWADGELAGSRCALELDAAFDAIPERVLRSLRAAIARCGQGAAK